MWQQLLVGIYAASAFGAAAATITPTSSNNSSAAPSSGSTLHLFLDFDGTIATSDAYDALAEAGYASLNSTITNTTTSFSTGQKKEVPSWDRVNAVYDTVASAVDATVPQASTLAGAIARADDAALRAVEEWSFDWVRELGVFGAETASLRESLVAKARAQTLRAGWCEFAAQGKREGVTIHVISLGWSPSWMRLILAEASGCPEVADRVETYCAEILPAGTLPLPGNGTGTGRDHDVPLFAGGDKTALMRRILADRGVGGGEGEGKEDRVVFVSDGDADLRPLWEGPTNVGVVAGFGGSAATTLGGYGVGVWNASEGWRGVTGAGAVGGWSGNVSAGAVYGFEDWRELGTLLWG